jgi:hypothetical protein
VVKHDDLQYERVSCSHSGRRGWGGVVDDDCAPGLGNCLLFPQELSPSEVDSVCETDEPTVSHGFTSSIYLDRASFASKRCTGSILVIDTNGDEDRQRHERNAR